jgi:hypothetical protein
MLPSLLGMAPWSSCFVARDVADSPAMRRATEPPRLPVAPQTTMSLVMGAKVFGEWDGM